MPNIFKGIKQVTWDYYNNLDDEAKVGYLWFIRTPNPDSATTGSEYYHDIYFGTRLYGSSRQYADEMCGDLYNMLLQAGVVDQSGEPQPVISKDELSDALDVVLSGVAETYETKEHAEETYETSSHASETYETAAHASETYATKAQLFDVTGATTGVLVVSGNDVDEPEPLLN